MALNVLALLALAHPGTDTTIQTQLLNLVNGYRQSHGVQPLTIHEPLCRAADGHAAFMFENNILTHDESPGLKAFTGAKLADRAALIGWRDECSELVGFATSGISDSVQAIFDSPCHRSRFLKPGFLSLGASAQGNFVCLLVGGGSGKAIVVSPPDGAQGVPCDWHGSTDFSGTRTGSGSRLFGYPLVFIDTTAGDKPFKTLQATLVDESGTLVPTETRDSANDPHYRTALAIIPRMPLNRGAHYEVHVVVQVANGKTDDKSWTFSTDN